jgi:hypothetical protein
VKKWPKELNRAFSKEEVQMAKKHMKKCSTSLAINKAQIKSTFRFHLTPVRIATIKNTNRKCWQGCGRKAALIHCWQECELVQPLWKTVWRMLTKQKIELLHGPAIPLRGIYPKECKSGYNKGTCTPIFIAALFTISKLWK